MRENGWAQGLYYAGWVAMFVVESVAWATCAGFIETLQTTVAGASPVGAAGELRASADAVLGAFRF